MNRLFPLSLCFVILTGCVKKRNSTENPRPSTTLSSYPFYFEEATDSPKWIKKDSKLIEIAFDEKRSEPEALVTIMGLAAEVLYPNADGHITLQGDLESDGKTFVLKHWYLGTDFIRRQFSRSPTEETTESKPGKLTPDDFIINLKMKAPHFSEQKYLKPLQ